MSRVMIASGTEPANEITKTTPSTNSTLGSARLTVKIGQPRRD